MTYNRTEVVYDIYSHLYREPQKIDCVRRGDKKFLNEKEMLSHLKTLEVPLNHIMNMFFMFLSSEELYNFFSYLFNNIRKDNYRLYVRDITEITGLDQKFNPTQPDLFFVGSNSTVSIEMKVKSHSDYKQILKYAFLHMKEEEKNNVEKEHFLFLLGVDSFNSFFDGAYNSIEELKIDCIKNIDKLPLKYQGNGRIISLIKKIHIHYFSYKDFSEYLLKEYYNSDDFAKKNIYQGLIQELEERKLIEKL